jgi:hypothetical protein
MITTIARRSGARTAAIKIATITSRSQHARFIPGRSGVAGVSPASEVQICRVGAREGLLMVD